MKYAFGKKKEAYCPTTFGPSQSFIYGGTLYGQQQHPAQTTIIFFVNQSINRLTWRGITRDIDSAYSSCIGLN
jgi:hypothetical protein